MKFNARTVAEKMWGTGGTKAYKTNRTGAYYYSCSGHGGYVVRSEALTEEEKQKLNEFCSPDHVNYLTNLDTGEVYGIDYGPVERCVGRNRRFRYPAGARVDWVKCELYTFEEDCDWAILEHLTDIRCPSRTTWDEEKMKEYAAKTFEYNAKRRQEVTA